MVRYPIGLTFRPILLVLLCIISIRPTDAQDLISVRVLDEASPSSVTVVARASDLDVYAGEFDQPIGTITEGEEAHIDQTDAQLSIVVDGMRLFADHLRIRGDASLLLRATDANGDDAERVFPGELRISPGPSSRLILENVLDVERYVASVVAHEYGFDDIEGARAMAVVARTYALKKMNSGATLVDHVDSQVYGDELRITDISRQAAEDTRGEVLTFGGELIEAVYSSSSGGMTANNEDVWDGPALPYLRSRNDPFDRDSPHRNWTSRVDRDRLLRALSRSTGTTVNGFISGDRGPDGRVRHVELLSTSGPRTEISGERFRRMVNAEFGTSSLKSTNFDARRDGNEYVFQGSGFGHGVGLNQHGARFLAGQGYSYQDILGYYYSGVSLATHRDGRPSGSGERLIPDRLLLADAGETIPDVTPPSQPTIAEERRALPEETNVTNREDVRERVPLRRTSSGRTGKRIGW